MQRLDQGESFLRCKNTVQSQSRADAQRRDGAVTTDLRDPALNFILAVGIQDGHTYRDVKPLMDGIDHLPSKDVVTHRACVLWCNGQMVQDQPSVRMVTKRWMLEAGQGRGYADCEIQ